MCTNEKRVYSWRFLLSNQVYCTVVDIIDTFDVGIDEVNNVEVMSNDDVVGCCCGAKVVASVVKTDKSCVETAVVVRAVDIVDKVVVSISSGAFGMNGYCGQGNAIGGPSIFSNTYPTIDPTVSPVMYEMVMIFPVISFKGVETFWDAIIIGKLPASPLDTPRAVVKINAGSSPPIVGFLRGATHSNNRGINSARSVDIKTNCRLDQEYRTAAKSFPTTSAELNVNMSSTGIHDFNLHEIISDSIPG